MAIARTMLEDVLTPSAYQRVNRLGALLADGLEHLFTDRGLPWKAFRCGPRSGYCLSPQLPRTGAEGYLSLEYDLIDARRVFMANRGIWDAVAAAGPQASIAQSAANIETYLAAAGEFIDAIL